MKAFKTLLFLYQTLSSPWKRLEEHNFTNLDNPSTEVQYTVEKSQEELFNTYKKVKDEELTYITSNYCKREWRTAICGVA